jgi:NAD(P)-dependent dehydrogenase (short-subunit alcohol dehydrogenase family)
MSKVWLVTGSGSGLGRHIADAVLASGDRLVATARDPRRLDALVEKYPDQVRTAALDVVDEDAARAAVDTNFYGVVNVTRAAIPFMRKQRSGCILQISSVGGRLAFPGSAAYHAAKWAVGGFTEALAQELAPFNVRVCALEPGGMRTNWGTRANQDMPEPLPDYEPSVGATAKALKPLSGAMRTAIRPAWPRSSFVWRPATAYPRISCWAVTPFSTPARPRRRAPPTRAAGGRRPCSALWLPLIGAVPRPAR